MLEHWRWAIYLGIALPAFGAGPDLSACKSMADADARLACYDHLTGYEPPVQPNAGFIIPDPAFLAAQLRVHPERADFALTVEKFVHLIQSAEFDEKQKIQLHGWQRTALGYALDITLRQPIRLEFTFQNRSFSLLQPVQHNGARLDPAQFIYIIASMAPNN